MSAYQAVSWLQVARRKVQTMGLPDIETIPGKIIFKKTKKEHAHAHEREKKKEKERAQIQTHLQTYRVFWIIVTLAV